MMTTMCALPIAMGQGTGGEVRRPLGLCVVGGLLFSQRITLYLTPVVYLYLAKVQSKISRPKITPATPGERAFAPTGD
jgi:HAE1 family hydrophobic/amphiphilic exporter-1